MSKEPIKKILHAKHPIPWGLLVIVISIFTIILYPNLMATKYNYNLGDVVERDIKAPRNFYFKDKAATAEKIRIETESILTVYDYDPNLVVKITDRIQKSFSELRTTIKNFKPIVQEKLSENPLLQDEAIPKGPDLHDIVWQKKADFENILGIELSRGAYKVLEKEKFKTEISDLLITIITKILENGVVANKDILLRESDKGITLRFIGQNTEHVEYNLKKFYGMDQAQAMVRIIGQPLLKDQNYTTLNLIVDMAQRLIQPNITLNRSETEERKKNAAAKVKPVHYQIKAGEMLIREGERVTPTQLLKLKALESDSNQDQMTSSSVGTALLLLCIFISVYVLHVKDQKIIILDRNRNLIFVTSILLAFLFVAKVFSSLTISSIQGISFPIFVSSLIYGIPLSSSAMTVCMFLGLDMAIPFALVISICTAIIFGSRFEIFIYFLINSMISAYWIQRSRERKTFIKTGLKLGLLNILLVTAIQVYLADISTSRLIWDWVWGFFGGIVAGMLTIGIAPLVELAFGYTTDISLLELSNLDQPILHRLMIEAPGTYHHSVIVGSLVEAAATEIGANPLLAKVCGYYHDIGKVNKPLYFIENQTGGKNKHDKLAPSMSSLILIKHIKDGVDMAKKYKLGRAIIDTIRQHHGTSLIRYFYEKAKQLKGEDAVKIDDFRYPGPKPQTREAGLVMLADVVEAASRTLDNPTPSRIQGLVQNLINKIFSDGQLDECELTLKDLHNIAKSFNKILCGIHHHRIEYEQNLASTNGKKKNGSTDRQSTKQMQVKPEENQEDKSGTLKRLGLS